MEGSSTVGQYKVDQMVNMPLVIINSNVYYISVNELLVILTISLFEPEKCYNIDVVKDFYLFCFILTNLSFFDRGITLRQLPKLMQLTYLETKHLLIQKTQHNDVK